ncbi:hypothetical protein ACFQ08_18470, partial [Streptosporangium algeriense]
MASHDEQWVRWHVHDDTLAARDVQCGVRNLDFPHLPLAPSAQPWRGRADTVPPGAETAADHPCLSQFVAG